MKLSISLGVFGPWQLIAILLLLGIIAGIIVLIVKLTTRNSGNESTYQSATDPLDQLASLNKLKQDGALSEVEFEIEKRKVLGNN